MRNKVVDWYDTLEYFGVDTANKNWNQIKERFEQDYNAKPTPHTSVKAFKGFKYLVTLIIQIIYTECYTFNYKDNLDPG